VTTELLLSTSPLDESLPRYVEIIGMLPDSYCSKLVIDRQRISVMDPEKYRIRVDGVWIMLWNEQTKRCGK
jgi:hypothetical protein